MTGAQVCFKRGKVAMARSQKLEPGPECTAQLEIAVEAFDEALGLEPEHLGALRERAFALAQLGQHEAALDSFVAAAKGQTGDPQFLLGVAQSLVKLHRHAEALKGFDQVLELRPTESEALFGRAAALTALGDYAQAHDAWGVALAAWGKKKTKIMLHGRKVAGAAVCLAHAQFARALALAALNPHSALAAFRELVDRPALVAAAERTELARSALQIWLSTHANEPSSLRRAGELWFEPQRNVEALAAWDVVTPFARAWFDQADANARAGELSTAIYGLERSLELWPGFSAARARLNEVQAQRNAGRWAVMSHDAYAREDTMVGEFASKGEAEARAAQLRTQFEHFWVVPLA